MERLDKYLYKIGENKEELSYDFGQRTIEIIKRKRKEFFAHSGLIFAVFILITYISGMALNSVKHNMGNLVIYIFISISFFVVSFTLFWSISNERFVTKFLDKILGKHFVETHINKKNCYFTKE